ncbi:uncharacterized protein F5147DRAFT_420222 [Suillus discolor]|uniref:Secreted protein n=1 Tax=Suillus discolor TaxID=1912936 RepID=A0A9P7JNC9_9AGAM|nr:uncharacterized protein F5147DRAFT_420222 [Suillus discolor]KAG2093485.1 hypothetical protein F5147DRAFT_420222 [Suillus discolor]
MFGFHRILIILTTIVRAALGPSPAGSKGLRALIQEGAKFVAGLAASKPGSIRSPPLRHTTFFMSELLSAECNLGDTIIVSHQYMSTLYQKLSRVCLDYHRTHQIHQTQTSRASMTSPPMVIWQ